MNYKSLLPAVALAAVMMACAREEAPFEGNSPVPATISVSIPKDGLTKVALSQDTDPDGVVKLTWESTDIITVEDAADDSKSVEFTYVSGAGTASAEFSAADITPLSGATSYNIRLTSNLPGGFANQTQASDGSTAHLGYAATISGVSTYDDATFSQAWATSHGSGTFASSSVLRIRAQMPTAAIANAVQKVVVKSSVPIFDEGNELAVTLGTPGTSGKVVTVYATLPSGDVIIPAGTELLFQFQVSADVHDKYTAYRKTTAAQSLIGGQVNAFKINCPSIESFAGPDDDGTQEKPYLIGDRHQMDAMHTLLGDNESKYFKMVDDVDLAAINPWEPLCLSVSENKEIHFDGGRHTISHLTADATYNYPSFFGFLWGEVKNVVFDAASITCNNEKDKSGGVVSGYIGGSGHQGDCSGVTIINSTLTSGGGSAFLGGLGGRVGKASYFTDCHVINTTLTSSGGNVGGLLSYIASNASTSITDCSADRVTISITGANYGGGLVSQIASDNVTIRRCHTSGTIRRQSGATRHMGGLVGLIQKAGIQIVNCYSTCTINGYQWAGGLVGSWWTGSSGSMDHCFASGDVSSSYGYGAFGGLVGTIQVPDVSITNCVAWNSLIKQRLSSDYSSGAVVGYTHPNCVLTNNYRKPGMTFTNLYWAPSASFDHPDVNGTTAPLVRIGTDLIEANAVPETTLTELEEASKTRWAYHGHPLPSSAVVVPDDTYGWVSDDISGGSAPDTDPEASGWTDTPTLDLNALGATTYTVRDGVQYTHFHGQWQGEWREINIVRTTLNEHNSLGVYYNYQDDGLLFLNEKCEYLDAIAGTNGSMACCQFVRVDDVVKHAATASSEWTANCALTIDNGVVNIVKVNGNSGAAMLPNRTVSCAGPLLVWKGNLLELPQEWLDADSDAWLTTTHPRTAIGLSKDGKTVIQVTVDGRWNNSSSPTSRRAIGMSVTLLAQLMKGLGCYKAMNFDGGGGTCMWVYGYGDSRFIVNHPHNPLNNKYYWTPATLRETGSAVYIHSDLK